MKINLAGVAICALLAGCGGTAPFGEDNNGDPGTGGPTTGGDDGGPISSDGIPPGTASPQPNTRIFRKEPTSTNEATNGNGFAQDITYEASTDTFAVDNLPFDGGEDTPYVRGTAVSSLNGFNVYEAVRQYPDTATGQAINNFTHRAIYGQSTNLNPDGTPATQFAIVRTGAYVQYGFGGFIYQRDGGVVMPTSGQARFDGRGAGIRDFNGRGGIEYSTSDVQVLIDFDDFNADDTARGGAVNGFVYNRQVYDIDGNDVTNDVLGRINAENNASLTAIPTAIFTIRPGALDANGEAVGELTSRFSNNNGDVVAYEQGNYYAIVSGEAEEVVGVVVLENTADPIADSVRDTTGFVVYRNPPTP